ncbi:MAG: halocyanin domain-containing protein [Halobacteria archaeon]|nr:halocyanin domain-containing protein [Halobacteria archaeon]
MERREFVKVSGVTAAGGLTGLAGCMGGSEEGGGNQTGGGEGSGSGGGGGSKPSYGGWMSDANNYDKVVDKTGQSEVTVKVGVGDRNYAFGPAVVKVSPGTKVVWEWTGKGGSHNVVAKEGTGVQLMKSSNLKSKKGATYSHTFDTAGTYKYFCTPHRSLGMKGVVVVE